MTKLVMSVKFYVVFVYFADLMCVNVSHTGLDQTVAQLFAPSKLLSTIMPN